MVVLRRDYLRHNDLPSKGLYCNLSWANMYTQSPNERYLDHRRCFQHLLYLLPLCDDLPMPPCILLLATIYYRVFRLLYVTNRRRRFDIRA